MLRVQAGDLEAFELLGRKFQTTVHGLAISMLRRPEDAEEATQDTFLKLFRARSRFDGQRKFAPWLLRIAGNACRDRLRRRRAADLPTVHLDELPDLRVGNGVADEHVAPTVHGELDRLSDKVRLPLELKYLRGQTNQEIAAALGISVSNVKVQLARGKDLLASRLQAIGATWGRIKSGGVGGGSARGRPAGPEEEGGVA